MKILLAQKHLKPTFAGNMMVVYPQVYTDQTDQQMWELRLNDRRGNLIMGR